MALDLGEVHRTHPGSGAERGEFGVERLGLFVDDEVEPGDIEAASGQRERDGAAEALTSTCDERDGSGHGHTSSHSARTSGAAVRSCGVPSKTISPCPMT